MPRHKPAEKKVIRIRQEYPELQILKPSPKRQRGTREQTHNFSMRVLIDDAELFVRYCDSERVTYREAFDMMLRAAGIKS